MNTSTLNLERQADALARAQKLRHSVQPTEMARITKPAWTIALTREAGTEASAVAQEIGRRLNWTVYDRELVECIARDMGLRSALLESVDEKQKSWLIECVESMTAAGSVTEVKYVKHLVETLLSLSKHGDCVIVGRGAAFVLPATSTLRVRLVGERQDRIKNVQRMQHIAATEAVGWLDRTDRARVQFVKEYFYKDATDPGVYDLVLNISRWSSAECAGIVVDALKQIASRS